jgi:hypothetical protein
MFAPAAPFPGPEQVFPETKQELNTSIRSVMFVAEVQPMMVEPLPASRWRLLLKISAAVYASGERRRASRRQVIAIKHACPSADNP